MRLDVLFFAQLRKEKAWTKITMDGSLLVNPVSRSHVTQQPIGVGDLLTAFGTLLPLVDSFGMHPQSDLCPELFVTFVTFEGEEILVLGPLVFCQIVL